MHETKLLFFPLRRERRSERGSVMGHHGHQNQQMTTQTWPFVEIFAHKRYFYLEAQSFTLDGHPEIFLWVWFLGLYPILNTM